MKYSADWKSLSAYRLPEWFRDAKFGIFIHWGPFSVPAFGGRKDPNERSSGNGVWYPYNMYQPGTQAYEYHRATYGDQKTFGYKDFVPLFRGENFDADAWVTLFKECGAQYVVPVADYHDGFPMFDCSYSGQWTAARSGPKRDVVGELAAATRKAGLKFGASSHRAANWWFYAFDDAFDTTDPANVELYGTPHSHDEDSEPSDEFLENWRKRTRELVEKYKLDLIWFDMGWETAAYDRVRPDFVAWYYNWAHDNGVEPVLQTKGQIPRSIAVLDVERGGLEELHQDFWQVDTSVSKKTWCCDIDDDLKTPKQIVDQLVDVVGKNGGLLLNVGPNADGTIPEEQQAIIREVGRWLSVNGEAIYGTRPWWIHGEGDLTWQERHHRKDDGFRFGAFSDSDTPEMTARYSRYTTRGDILYVTVMGWPETGRVTIRYLGEGSAYYPGGIGRISLLGTDERISWRRDVRGLTIEFPATRPAACDHAYAFRIEPR